MWPAVQQTMLFAIMSSLRRATVDLLTWQDAELDAVKRFELLKSLAHGADNHGWHTW
jgi:hypothetical protein